MLEFARRGYDELEVFRDLDPRIGLGIGVIDIKDNEIETPGPDRRAASSTLAKRSGAERVRLRPSRLRLLDAAAQRGRPQDARAGRRARSLRGQTLNDDGGPFADAERAAVRSTVFTHLAGLVVRRRSARSGSVARSNRFTSASRPVPSKIWSRTHANPGYLASRFGCWRRADGSPERGAERGSECGVTPLRAAGRRNCPVLRPAACTASHGVLPAEGAYPRRFTVRPARRPDDCRRSASWCERVAGGVAFRASEDRLTAKVHALVRGHLDGMLVGPAMVALARGGVLARLVESPARPAVVPRPTRRRPRACSICLGDRMGQSTGRPCS